MQVPIDAPLISEFCTDKSQDGSLAAPLLCRKTVLLEKHSGCLFLPEQLLAFCFRSSSSRTFQVLRLESVISLPARA